MPQLILKNYITADIKKMIISNNHLLTIKHGFVA
jgi:hypothetical protein